MQQLANVVAQQAPLCRVVDDVGNFLRPRSRMSEFVCPADRKERFVKGVEELEAIVKAA